MLRSVRRAAGSMRLRGYATVIAPGAAVVTGIAVAVGVAAGGVSARHDQAGQGDGGAARQDSAPRRAVPRYAVQVGQPARAADFTGIILPDLLIVMPSGLTAAEIARLRAVKGVRNMITFDGAQITIGGAPASVIGVNPDQFRSWVPLRAASDQSLWARLAAGDVIAERSAAGRLGLVTPARYRLTGRSSVDLAFGGSAALGVAGVDLLVNQAGSRRLGLVRQVAALISAPGPAMSTLIARVRQIVGADVRVVGLRAQAVPTSAYQPGQIKNYLDLFRASAARYCPALSWTVLAAIGQIESGDGRNMGPSSAGALGPMQFMPGTWAAWGIDGFGPAGPPDVWNPFDAVPAAARMLCADGASARTQAGLRQAIFDYNHADWYVTEVLALASQYAAEYR
ncbi:MAG TPA: lytic transglycosylase domain-containing protein [Streptosporangiaceae bacterium]|nr:lytic transglycosylase domain-containing protein [Streptosporangiaceae bacterium]